MILAAQEIEPIAKRRLKRIHSCLEKMKKVPDEETIHDFRLGIKMMRAYLRMLNFEDNDAIRLSLPGDLKKIYSLSGKIRDLQLHLKKVNELINIGNDLHGYRNSLEVKCRKRILRLKAVIKRKVPGNPERNMIRQLPGQLHSVTLKKFIREKSNEIYVILESAHYFDEEIHQVRKNLKDIIYVSKILKKEYAGAVRVWKKKQVKEAAVLADRLGAFNDCCINLSLLQPGRLNKLSIGEQGILYVIRSKWLKEKEDLKDSLLIDLVSSIRRFLPGKVKLKELTEFHN